MRTSLLKQLPGRVGTIEILGSYWMIPLQMALDRPAAAFFGPRAELVGSARAEPSLSCWR